MSGLPSGKRILVVDDEKKIVALVRAYLEQAGYQVLVAGDGQEALHAARRERPDLIILDLMLPKMDGWEVSRVLRQESQVPIIMLTARVEDTDKIVGLELGADDYVTKPFNPRELVARVRSVLRRTQRPTLAAEVLRVGGLTLDRGRHAAMVDGEPVALTPTEFNLLSVLMTNPGRAFSRLDLLDQVQGVAFDGYERTIDAHVKNLRAKIETDPRQPRYIETVHGIGYRLRDRSEDGE
ncbi:MAG: response regulator transcription factor [Anaerolineae bacterium]|nr:response regulator transcription factor [Anaerolineae bacterium]